MQINENQQAVPKNLRNTLNADLLWDSEGLRERASALKLRIAQHLGREIVPPVWTHHNWRESALVHVLYND